MSLHSNIIFYKKMQYICLFHTAESIQCFIIAHFLYFQAAFMLSTTKQPTIAAIATAAGRGGVGVIRVSGSNLLPFAQAISGGKTPKPRTALYH